MTKSNKHTKGKTMNATPALKTINKYVPPPKPDYSHLPLLDLSKLPKRALMQTLGQSLVIKRASGTMAEAGFVGWLVRYINQISEAGVHMIDEAGNIHVDLRRDEQDRTLFTAHTDTVHHNTDKTSEADTINLVRIDGDIWRADGDVLGADDGAGCALLMHMIECNVPGYYIFFRGEEVGGVGSGWLAKHGVSLLSQFDHAVAFDRAYEYDIITHQAGGRCCSEAFADALAEALTTDDAALMFAPSSGGVFTDTANFTDIIPECTNVSVGYEFQHSDRELQNVAFLQRLAAQLLLVDWSSLPVQRDPNVYESKYGGGSNKMDAYYADYYESLADKWQEFSDSGVQDAEYKLMEALEDYIDVGTSANLAKLVAELIYPEEPHLAAKTMDMRKLDVDWAGTHLDALYNGFAALEVADDIYEIVRTV